jgi:hypothetical protein
VIGGIWIWVWNFNFCDVDRMEIKSEFKNLLPLFKNIALDSPPSEF